MSEATIPSDYFSRRLRELRDNPGALSARSSIDVQDFYGNLEPRHVDTYRSHGKDETFIQRNKADKALLDALRSVCERYTGNCPIQLNVLMPDGGNIVIRAGRTTSVRPCEEFETDVCDLLGKDCLKWVARTPEPPPRRNGRYPKRAANA